MKTFKEFFLEANRHPIPKDERMQWIKDREEGKGPATKTFDGVEYEMRGKGFRKGKKQWGVSTTASRKASFLKRKESEENSRLTRDELLNKTGGDEERVSLALDTERSGIKKVRRRSKGIQKATGIKQSLGHKQPVQPDDPSPEDPGHTLSNVMIEPYVLNVSKQNKRPKPGESGYGLTRSQAIQDADRRGSELGKKIDRERNLENIRAARLLSYLRRPKPKFKNSEERAREQRERMNAAADKRNLPD